MSFTVLLCWEFQLKTFKDILTALERSVSENTLPVSCFYDFVLFCAKKEEVT